MSKDTTGSGKNFQILATAISDAIHAALIRGMKIDEAASCTVAIAADYARVEYGDAYLHGLAQLVIGRKEMPFPKYDYLP